MPRGRPLEGAPGWRVIERPRRRSWRAGYVIVPIALAVASLQFLIPALYDRLGSPEARLQGPVPERPVPGTDFSSVEESAEAPAEPRPQPPAAGGTRRVEAARPPMPDPPMPDPRPLASRVGADQPAAEAPPAIRVFIHHAAGNGNALPAIQLAAFLQARGFTVTDIRPVELEIEQPSVRYFFEDDQPETLRLVEAIGAFFADAPHRAPDRPADFSHFSPKPSQGNVEIWLPPPGADQNQST